MRTRICASLTCANDRCVHRSHAHQSIPSDDLCISICYFRIESSKRRNDQQARWPTGKPPLTAYVYTRTKRPIGSCAELRAVMNAYSSPRPALAMLTHPKTPTGRGCNPPDQKRVLMYAEREKLTRRPRKTRRTVRPVPGLLTRLRH